MSAPAPIAWRTLAWAIGPVIAVLLLRAALQATVGADLGDLQPLRAATLVGDPTQALWAAARPFVFTLLAIGAAGIALRQALRRLGWARAKPGLVALWLLGWAAGGTWLLADHLNRSARQRHRRARGVCPLLGQHFSEALPHRVAGGVAHQHAVLDQPAFLTATEGPDGCFDAILLHVRATDQQ